MDLQCSRLLSWGCEVKMDFLVLVIDVYIGDIAGSFHFYQEPGGKKKLFNLYTYCVLFMGQ